MRLGTFIFLFILSTGAFAAEKDYSNRYGVRFSAGVSGYTAVGSRGYGLALPLALEGTYGVTKALEALVGFRGSPSVLIGNAPFALPYALTLGIRYYYNVGEPVKAFTVACVNIGLDRFGFEFSPSLWGLQWDIDDNFSVFGESGLAFLIGTNPNNFDRSEYNIRFGLSVGAHYHF